MSPKANQKLKMKLVNTQYGQVELSDAQVKNAKKAGMTLREAAELMVEARHEEAHDRKNYAEMSAAEREAHDNL